MPNNYALIDGTNIHLSTVHIGWQIDWRAFREYLSKRHHVSLAHYFVGYMPEYEDTYRTLAGYGYSLVHKPVLRLADGTVKGNCDAELVLQAMIDLPTYDKAVIVSGDGDLSCLVRYLTSVGKFKLLIACRKDSCSHLLRKEAGGNIMFLDFLRGRLEKK